ncbi:MAG: pyrroline-5-carboxylate reductase [Synergistaceae bacterium]
MKYGFLGAGNMGSAIIKGMVNSSFNAKDIFVYDTNKDKVSEMSLECGINLLSSQEEVFSCDVVILAVKPYVLDSLKDKLNAIYTDLNSKEKIIISIAVGKSLSYLSEIFPDASLVRVMPNINAMVSSSITGYCIGTNVTNEKEKIVTDVFAGLGAVIKIEEKNMSIFGAIAGSSPAFTYMYIDALARAGVKSGLSKEQALQIATHSVLGSAKMILLSDKHPMELTDMVCSPAGTTICGVLSLRKNAFEGDIAEAVEAVLKRDAEIGGMKNDK